MSIHLRLEQLQPDRETPSAMDTYRALRKDPSGETGKQIKTALQELREDPGKVRARSLRYRPDLWVTRVQVPGSAVWWVVWRQPGPDEVIVRYLGPEPGSFTPVAYTSG